MWWRIFIICLMLAVIPASLSAEVESRCFGTTSDGRLEGGVKLPGSGPNFVSYGTLPSLAGRTYVHNKVRDVVLDAYASLAQDLPGVVFKYAETGKAEGGPFPPHKTHQNGLSVDFMVPVRNRDGQSVHLPSHPLNRYGYDVEFDSKGRWEDLTIDFEALAAHVVALHHSAQRHGIGLWRVLFAPNLQPHLYATRLGDFIRANIHIPTKRSWVRHDDHIHVDFAVPCEKLDQN